MSPNKTNTLKGQILYISHGGGPLPILGDSGHVKMVEFMKYLPKLLKKPEVIVVVSAHWEEQVVTVLSSPNPKLIYDYYGFPKEAYEIRYPAPGNPEFASKIVSLLNRCEIKSNLDNERGFDHGLYIPLMLMYPDADIPSIEISLAKGLDPSFHFEIGNALSELMNENVLVIGSGFSFHNMKEFIWDESKREDKANDFFQDWLIKTCIQSVPLYDRKEQLANWEHAPSARYCHPREEHLLPLHVCAGIAGESMQATKVFDDYILGKRAIGFLW